MHSFVRESVSIFFFARTAAKIGPMTLSFCCAAAVIGVMSPMRDTGVIVIGLAVSDMVV